MSHVFPRHSKARLPTVATGKGVYLYDQQGRQYLDGSGGAAVSCLGHGDEDVTAAIKAQLDKVAFAHTGFLTSEPAEQLASTLVDLAPNGIDRVYLVSGGSEAVEAAMKLARQYFWRGERPVAGISLPAGKVIMAIRSRHWRRVETSGAGHLSSR